MNKYFILSILFSMSACIQADPITGSKGGVIDLTERPSPDTQSDSPREAPDPSDNDEDWVEYEYEEEYTLEYDTPSNGSCWFDDSICFETEGDTLSWCDTMSNQYGSIFDIWFSDSFCAGNEVGVCYLEAVGDFVDESIAYYYEPFYDASTAEAACSSAGGTFD